MNDPDFLVLDEPTTGLDPQARHVMWDRLKQLLARGKTILLTCTSWKRRSASAPGSSSFSGRFIAEGSPRELIAAQIEPHVVEVHGDGLDGWCEGEARALAAAMSARATRPYVRDAAPLLAHLERQAGLRYLHRPANLEDVF